MSSEGVKNLFVDFGKLKENENRNKSGTGLGLSICKQIIEKMGGSVDVKSKPNVGTEFIINIKSKCLYDDESIKIVPSKHKNFVFIEKPHEQTTLVSCIAHKFKANLKRAVQESEKCITLYSMNSWKKEKEQSKRGISRDMISSPKKIREI